MLRTPAKTTTVHPQRPLLTIAVPTYNRAGDLSRLLDALQRELAGQQHRVGLVIANNASTDHTAAVIERFASLWQGVQVVTQSINVGMDGNFCTCAEAVNGEFFWIMGDDDLPVPGAIRMLLDLLDEERPDLVGLSSRWVRNIDDAATDALSGPLRYVRLSCDDFGRRLHVWTTFLTGMIVRRAPLLDDPLAVRKFAGTHLSQMSWIMDRLREGHKFIHVETPCVLATAGGSGGYSVVKVFGQHFPRIVRDSLASTQRERRLARAIVLRTMLAYLPNLLWDLRHARIGDFQPENITEALRPQLGSHPLTVLILLPIGRLPQPAARLVLKIASGLARVTAAIDRLRARKRPAS